MNKEDLIKLREQLIFIRENIDANIREIDKRIQDDSGLDLVLSKINEAIGSPIKYSELEDNSYHGKSTTEESNNSQEYSESTINYLRKHNLL